MAQESVGLRSLRDRIGTADGAAGPARPLPVAGIRDMAARARPIHPYRHGALRPTRPTLEREGAGVLRDAWDQGR